MIICDFYGGKEIGDVFLVGLWCFWGLVWMCFMVSVVLLNLKFVLNIFFYFNMGRSGLKDS